MLFCFTCYFKLKSVWSVRTHKDCHNFNLGWKLRLNFMMVQNQSEVSELVEF